MLTQKRVDTLSRERPDLVAIIEDFLVMQATGLVMPWMPSADKKWQMVIKLCSIEWTLQKLLVDKANSRCPWSK